MNLSSSELARAIKQEAARIGFDACGFADAGPVDPAARVHFDHWLGNDCQAGMDYMTRNREKRLNPQMLTENARSVIVVALNYYPAVFQPSGNPQFAYYAYGKDYHEIMRNKLSGLFEFIRTLVPVKGRIFCDTAPVWERYWAYRAGIGFIGRNTQLIIPGKGSYFFLGEIITDLQLPSGRPVPNRCGSCRRCIQNCPGEALKNPFTLDANRCLSYHTIENKGELPLPIKEKLGNRVYGCDICQQSCPWNRFATPNTTPEFQPLPDFLSLDTNALRALTPDGFNEIFRHSAVKRTKFSGLKRNTEALK